MFALPGVASLVVFVLARPFDFVDQLRGIPFLYIFFALAVFGFVLDVRLGYIRLHRTPLLFWALGFVVWCFVTAVLRAPSVLAQRGILLAIVFAIFVIIAQGLQTFKAYQALVGTILACSLWISLVCVHQGLQPLTCVATAQGDDHTTMGRPDGRPCDKPEICYQDPPEPQARYRCEHAGLFGVTSIANGRVRYVGVLHDPNEASLAVAISLPIAVAFYRRRRSHKNLFLLLITALFTAATVLMSKSRGGVLIYLAVVGIYILHRYKWKGIALGAMLGMPLLLVGGRSGKHASASTMERLDCWYEGLEMFRSSPLVGVGYSQFTEHHHLTAHNSVVLAIAELGALGLLIWTGLMYMALKIPLMILMRVKEREAEVARTWALALLASLSGLCVGSFFLSFNYHFVLWIYVGLAGALWSAVKMHAPHFKVRFGLRDLAGLVAFDGAVIAGIFVYTRLKLG